MIPSALSMARDLIHTNGDWDDAQLVKGLASLICSWMPVNEQHNAERDAAAAIKQARSEPVFDIRNTQSYRDRREKLKKAREAAGGRPGWYVDMLVSEGKMIGEKANEFKRRHAAYLRKEASAMQARADELAASLPTA